MKYIIYTLLLVLALTSYSCTGFLDRSPITEPNNETYLSGESQVRSYINGLYTQLPSLKTYGLGIWEEERNSDNIVAEIYDKRLNGEYKVFDGATEWTKGYASLRSANYFFAYYRVPADLESESVKSLIGEAHFFRAYWHFYLLTRFGNIPIMDEFWDGNATVEGLQIPQAKRSDVAKFILADLAKADELLLPRSASSGLRINKEAALILAMRVALYEGTWEKYHKGSDYAQEDLSVEFFEKVIELGDLLFAENIKLHTIVGDVKGKAFGDLFRSTDLSSIEEVAFWKQYSNAENTFHALQSLVSAGITAMASPAGLSLSLVNNYLNSDGTFINPNDPKYKDFNQTFLSRDNRLIQTVMSAGVRFKSTTSPLLIRALTGNEAEDEAVNPPYLHGNAQYQNVTGFHTRLGVVDSYESGNSETALVYFRYAEALLAYAEAAEELGRCDATVLEKTIKPLRERAGVTYVQPTLDPNAPSYGYVISANLQEIRRERRAELAIQSFRQDDIFRWRAHELIKDKRAKGAYLGREQVLYKSYNADQLEMVDLVLVDPDGWMDPQKDRLLSGYQFRVGQDYLLPIPADELQLNKTLKQTPGSW